ncbi:MAG TPA: SDR family oxidoreductase, partial [Candidatus Polarisedimenticolia bacterium]|nr:SDR family oxidoreductase [Candidatus Polarisedimenticolia bacterium]
EAIERAVEGAGVVYHAAAMVEGPGSPEEFTAANVAGTQNVFEACMRNGVPHVVYLSSIAVYGLAERSEQITESTPFDPEPQRRDAYAQSKIEADKYAVAVGRKTKLAVTILRPGVVYGPGRRLPIALLGFRFVNTNVVFGRRDQRFPLTYVENLIDAMEMAGRRAGGGLREYIVIDDDDLTLSRYHAVREEMDHQRTWFLPGWPLLLGPVVYECFAWIIAFGSSRAQMWRRQMRRALQDRWYDTTRIRKKIGWAPKVPLREAIEQTIRPTRRRQ